MIVLRGSTASLLHEIKVGKLAPNNILFLNCCGRKNKHFCFNCKKSMKVVHYRYRYHKYRVWRHLNYILCASSVWALFVLLRCCEQRLLLRGLVLGDDPPLWRLHAVRHRRQSVDLQHMQVPMATTITMMLLIIIIRRRCHRSPVFRFLPKRYVWVAMISRDKRFSCGFRKSSVISHVVLLDLHYLTLLWLMTQHSFTNKMMLCSTMA